jgi:hypothetical protein
LVFQHQLFIVILAALAKRIQVSNHLNCLIFKTV